MSTSEEESVSIWVLLGQLATIILIFVAGWAAIAVTETSELGRISLDPLLDARAGRAVRSAPMPRLIMICQAEEEVHLAPRVPGAPTSPRLESVGGEPAIIAPAVKRTRGDEQNARQGKQQCR